MNKLEWRHQTGRISPSKEKDFFAKMKRLQADFKRLKKEEEDSSSSVLREVRQAEKSSRRLMMQSLMHQRNRRSPFTNDGVIK